MGNVLIIGASGGIARMVIDQLKDDENIKLTLFLRNANKISHLDSLSRFRVIEGDAQDKNKLIEAMQGQDFVYENLAGDQMGLMTRNIVEAMQETGVTHLLLMSTIDIYTEPPVYKPYREATDIVENSGLAYTILRPSWFTDADEVNYELRGKEVPENKGTISRKSLATVVCDIIRNPKNYMNQNLNVSKPAIN